MDMNKEFEKYIQYCLDYGYEIRHISSKGDSFITGGEYWGVYREEMYTNTLIGMIHYKLNGDLIYFYDSGSVDYAPFGAPFNALSEFKYLLTQ